MVSNNSLQQYEHKGEHQYQHRHYQPARQSKRVVASSSAVRVLCGFVQRAFGERFGRSATAQLVEQVALLVGEAERMVEATWATIEKIHSVSGFLYQIFQFLLTINTLINNVAVLKNGKKLDIACARLYLCIRLAASQQLKQTRFLLSSVCTIFALATSLGSSVLWLIYIIIYIRCVRLRSSSADYRVKQLIPVVVRGLRVVVALSVRCQQPCLAS